MSELQRSFAKAKLAGLPPFPPDTFDEEETDSFDASIGSHVEHPDDDSSSASSASSASSTGTIKPTISKNLFARPNGYHIRLLSQHLVCMYRGHGY
jgi:protein phosphatase methylesterase 1